MFDKRRAHALQNAAMTYALHGWPVTPLGSDGLRLNPTFVYTADDVADASWWGEPDACQLGVMCTSFDVLRVPSPDGASIWRTLGPSCITAKFRRSANARLHWLFFLERGSIRQRPLGTSRALLCGSDQYVIMPPSETELTGRVHWVVPPNQAQWQPYRRHDIFDRLGIAS